MAKSSAAPSPRSSTAATEIEQIRRAASVDLDRAIDLAGSAKARGLADPLIHRLVALGLKRRGLLSEAIGELGLALQLDPHDPRAIVEVGFCLLELGRKHEATRLFATAVKLAPRLADASFGFGCAAEQVGELEAAEAGFKRTLGLDPDHSGALTGLCGLACRRRQWEAARRYGERALGIDPGQIEAAMSLARVDLEVGEPAAAENRLRSLLERQDLSPQARGDAQIVLGDTLDRAGRYEEAHAAYAMGKSQLRAEYERRVGPGARTAFDAAAAILAEFQKTPPAAWARPAKARRSGPPIKGHAFLVGFPRSGTTLLEQVLAAHPDVVALDERPVMIDAEAEFLTQPGGIERLSEVVGALLEPLREAYWKQVGEFGVDPAGKLFIDKHPLSTFRLPLIAKMFPEAKLIFAIRDPRDVVLSCFRRAFNLNAAMCEFDSVERAARFYDLVMRAGDAYLQQLPLEVHRLRYEDLVADFEGTARAVCGFLGVDWTADLKDFATAAQARRIATPSSPQVLRGLYAEGVGQWRNYAFALEPAMDVLRPWIETFGYAERDAAAP